MDEYKQETKVEERTSDVNTTNSAPTSTNTTNANTTNANNPDANRVVERKTQNTVTYDGSESYFKLRKTVYLILGILETLLAFRLVFKLLGANPASGFVSFIYALTGVFLAPFIGIFRSAVTNGIETKAVLEPATVIGMIVYAIAAAGIVKLIKIYGAPKTK